MPTSPLTDDKVEALVAFCLTQDTLPLARNHLVPASEGERAMREVSWKSRVCNRSARC